MASNAEAELAIRISRWAMSALQITNDETIENNRI